MPCDASTLAGFEIAEMRGDGGRADVEGDAAGAIDEPGKDRDDFLALCARRR